MMSILDRYFHRPTGIAWLVGVTMLTVASSAALATATTQTASNTSKTPVFWQWAKTPPMGWNSYDYYNDKVTARQVLANARYLKAHLRQHGWRYVVVDFRWYDPKAAPAKIAAKSGVPLRIDKYGRLQPALNRFPHAKGESGFKHLADEIHAMGLKFGIHIMRGIPREAVAKNTPILNFKYTARDAGNKPSSSTWNHDMWGVKGDTPAGQAYYDSILKQYAAWGVDYIKCDDMSYPYHTNEIDALRKAIDKVDRPIVLSLSPGPTPLKDAKHVAHHANLWRITGDFWDNWKQLNKHFNVIHRWQDAVGPGHWPDPDMLPLGTIGKHLSFTGGEHYTHLTMDEQRTLMSLWAIEPAPLMLGDNLTTMDPWTLSLITNDQVLGVDQDPLGKPGRRVWQNNKTEIWAKSLADGSKAVALFNRGRQATTIVAKWQALGLQGKQQVHNLWTHQNFGIKEGKFSALVHGHGVVFVKMRAASDASSKSWRGTSGRELADR